MCAHKQPIVLKAEGTVGADGPVVQRWGHGNARSTAARGQRQQLPKPKEAVELGEGTAGTSGRGDGPCVCSPPLACKKK